MGLLRSDRRRALLQPDPWQRTGAWPEGIDQRETTPALPRDCGAPETLRGTPDRRSQSSYALGQTHGLRGNADLSPPNAICKPGGTQPMEYAVHRGRNVRC